MKYLPDEDRYPSGRLRHRLKWPYFIAGMLYVHTMDGVSGLAGAAVSFVAIVTLVTAVDFLTRRKVQQ